MYKAFISLCLIIFQKEDDSKMTWKTSLVEITFLKNVWPPTTNYLHMPTFVHTVGSPIPPLMSRWPLWKIPDHIGVIKKVRNDRGWVGMHYFCDELLRKIEHGCVNYSKALSTLDVVLSRINF